MKRMAIFSLVTFFWLLHGNVFAQQKLSPDDPGKGSTKWEMIKDGVWVQRLWSKDEWPQIAILKLSDDAYREFREDPAKFINSNKIFPVPVQQPAGPGASLSARKEPGGVWLVMLPHGRPSTMYWAAAPEPPETEINYPQKTQ
jgi:hypothetical protein